MNGRGVMVRKARVRVGRVESGSHRGELQMKLVLERKAILRRRMQRRVRQEAEERPWERCKRPRIISNNAGQGMKNGIEFGCCKVGLHDGRKGRGFPDTNNERKTQGSSVRENERHREGRRGRARMGGRHSKKGLQQRPPNSPRKRRRESRRAWRAHTPWRERAPHQKQDILAIAHPQHTHNTYTFMSPLQLFL